MAVIIAARRIINLRTRGFFEQKMIQEVMIISINR